MKVSRVSETKPVPEQESKEQRSYTRKFAFRVEPLLENDGDPNADENERREDGSEQFETSERKCYQISTTPGFPEHGDLNLAAKSMDDSLEEFLARIKRAHRLDLRL